MSISKVVPVCLAVLIAVFFSQFFVAQSSPLTKEAKHAKISTSRKVLVSTKLKYASRTKPNARANSEKLRFIQSKLRISDGEAQLNVKSSARLKEADYKLLYLQYKAKIDREKKQEAERKKREAAAKAAAAAAKAAALAKIRADKAAKLRKLKNSRSSKERRWVWLLKKRAYKIKRKYPLACACKTVPSNKNSKCYYFTNPRTYACKKRQCQPRHVCVSGYKTGLICIRRIAKMEVKPQYPGYCTKKSIRKPMYVPYAHT